MSNFALNLIQGERSSVNGRITRRVILTVDDEQKVIDHITLDSDISRDKAAKRWSERYGIDRDELAEQLNGLVVQVAAEDAERRAQRSEPTVPGKRVSDVADEFVASLKPAWHRKAKAIYFEEIGREVSVTEVWTHARNATIDATGNTQEAYELSRDGQPVPYRTLLALFKDAVRMAATRALADLSELEEVEADQTANRDQLIHRVVAVLIKVRQFNTDVGKTISDSYYGFACGVDLGSGWHRCYTYPVFARLDDTGKQPVIAIIGDHLTTELQRESKRKLAADLRSLKVANIDQVLRCDGKLWRAWAVFSDVLDSIAVTATNEGAQRV